MIIKTNIHQKPLFIRTSVDAIKEQMTTSEIKQADSNSTCKVVVMQYVLSDVYWFNSVASKYISNGIEMVII